MATTINISLPEPLSTYVEAKVAAGDYGTPSQYITELIQDDRDRRKHALEEHLIHALSENSEALEISDEDWEHGDIFGIIEEHAARAASNLRRFDLVVVSD
jgi:antitoxin ParD1/3/4